MSPAERTALGGGVNIYPLLNSRTISSTEVGKAVIESSQRVLFKGIEKNLKKVTTQVKVRSKVKIVTFCLIG